MSVCRKSVCVFDLEVASCSHYSQMSDGIVEDDTERRHQSGYAVVAVELLNRLVYAVGEVRVS